MSNIIPFPHQAPRIARERLPVAEVVEFDLSVADEGSIFLLHALSDLGVAWCDEHLGSNRQRWAERGTVIEHRYMAEILEGALEEGLSIYYIDG